MAYNKLLWLYMTKYLAFFLMFASNVLAVEVISEKSKDLGFGFRDVRQQVKMPKGHWEGIGHFGFLYFKDHKISQTSDFLISSDGKFVVFTDGPTGNVQAFFSVDRKIVLLEGYVKENGVPESFEEVGVGTIKAVFTSGKEKVFNVTSTP